MKTHYSPHTSRAASLESSFDYLFFESPETYVHPSAVVGPHVTLAQGVKIGPYAVVTGAVTIGARTQIHAHAMVGSSAQTLTVREPRGAVIIGSDTVIKEFVTICAATSDELTTRIGDHCILMQFSHVGHDVHIGNHVTLTNNVLLGGHACIQDRVVLMAHAAVHQRCRIGAYSALAPYTATGQDIPPFCTFIKQPAKFAGLNRFNLKRNNFSPYTINALKTLYRLFYHDRVATNELMAACTAAGIADDTAVQQSLDFILGSIRGISRQTVKGS